jgi:hypothetical protein
MEDIKSYTIQGKVSYNNEPVSGAKIKVDNNEASSDSNGNFSISGEYSEIFNLFISKENFSPYVSIPFDSQNNIKSNIGVVELSPLKIDLNENISKLQTLPEPAIKAIIASKTNFETLQQKKLNDLLITLQFTVLPIILKMLAEFGVSNAKQALDKKFTQPQTCPTPEQINKIIRKKNKLVKQLNIAYKVISTTSKVTDITLIFIIALEATLKLSSAIPAPPAQFDALDKKIKKYKLIVQTISMILKVLEVVLKEIINYLNLLDFYIQSCSSDSNITDITQEVISAELIALTQQQSQQQSPVVTNVNGFEMGVETEPTISTLSVKRRRAIAKNKQGIIMLKGEWSFSSIDQILIDELVFYIQTNDLRAD